MIISPKNYGLLTAILMHCTTSCTDPSIGSSGDDVQNFSLQEPIPALPLERTITDDQGRSFDATIIGKTESSIVVTRTIDQRNFRIPIPKLAESDRNFVNRLRYSPAPDGVAIEGERADTRPINGQPRYVAFRKEEIKRLYEEADRLRREARETTNAITKRSKRSEADRLDKEAAELRADIARFQENNP